MISVGMNGYVNPSRVLAVLSIWEGWEKQGRSVIAPQASAAITQPALPPAHVCEACGRGFAKQQSLAAHMRVHKNEVTKRKELP